MKCEGTGCTKTATNDLGIRARFTKGIILRQYCDDCTERARRREMSEVVWASPVKATGEQS